MAGCLIGLIIMFMGWIQVFHITQQVVDTLVPEDWSAFGKLLRRQFNL